MNSPQCFNALLIGLGQMGMGYDLHSSDDEKVLTHAKALSLHNRFDLIAAIDSCQQKQKLFSEHYNRPVFNSLAEFASEKETDLVVISTPTTTHLKLIYEVLDRLCPRLIICEKPFTLSVDEAEKAIDTCNKANCQLIINYIRRTEPGALQCKRLLQRGTLGKVEKGIVWYSKGLKHNGSHFINLLQSWLGPGELSQVMNTKNYGSEDISADIKFTFTGIPIYFLSREEANFSYYAVELDCTKGQLRYDDGGFKISFRKIEEDKHFPDYRKLSTVSQVIENDLIRYQLHAVDDWHQYLTLNRSSSCTANEALATHQLISSVVASCSGNESIK